MAGENFRDASSGESEEQRIKRIEDELWPVIRLKAMVKYREEIARLEKELEAIKEGKIEGKPRVWLKKAVDGRINTEDRAAAFVKEERASLVFFKKHEIYYFQILNSEGVEQPVSTDRAWDEIGKALAGRAAEFSYNPVRCVSAFGAAIHGVTTLITDKELQARLGDELTRLSEEWGCHFDNQVQKVSPSTAPANSSDGPA